MLKILKWATPMKRNFSPTSRAASRLPLESTHTLQAATSSVSFSRMTGGSIPSWYSISGSAMTISRYSTPNLRGRKIPLLSIISTACGTLETLSSATLRDVDKPFEPDPVNIAPRFGFAYNPDGRGSTVIRGGFGMMFSPLIWATFNNAVGNTTTIPFRRSFSRAEAAQLGLRYPVYNEDMATLVDRLGRISIADLFEPDYLHAPYTMNM